MPEGQQKFEAPKQEAETKEADASQARRPSVSSARLTSSTFSRASDLDRERWREGGREGERGRGRKSAGGGGERERERKGEKEVVF